MHGNDDPALLPSASIATAAAGSVGATAVKAAASATSTTPAAALGSLATWSSPFQQRAGDSAIELNTVYAESMRKEHHHVKKGADSSVQHCCATNNPGGELVPGVGLNAASSATCHVNIGQPGTCTAKAGSDQKRPGDALTGV